MFLYPLAITLILSSFARALFGQSKRLYRWPMVLAGIAAFGDALSALPQGLANSPLVLQILGYYKILPLFSLGMGWVVPTFVALLLAIISVKLVGDRA